jgi:ATP-dependent RNA helicase RhlE
LAVTLVTRDDTRLVGDIEKLIKKKLDLEPFELEDDRPRRAPRRDDETRDVPASPAARPPRDAAPSFAGDRPAAYTPRFAPRAAPVDPFFDKPYEPASSGSAAWEAGPKTAGAAGAAAPAGGGRGGLSPNIKPKRKVAALLGGGR